jgi:hypothetical protein
MSFANLKQSSKTQFKKLAEQLGNDSKGGYQKDERFWEPEVDSSGCGFAVIRFLPAPPGETSVYSRVYNHVFMHHKKWFIEECPTTINGKCPVCESNGELWDTGSKANKDIARKRKRVTRYISNILVISDAKHPENEGKVFLFKYGSQISTKLKSAVKPEFEDEVSFNPFDLWTGAPFKVKIRKVDGYRNYEMSGFGDVGPLFDDDDALEKVWNSEYPLMEFHDESRFKSYDKIKERLEGLYGKPQVQQRQVSEENDFDDDIPPEVTSRPKTRKPVASSVPTNDTDADADFELFSKLIDD